MRYIIIICCFTFCSAQVFSQYDYTGSRSTAMSGAVTSGPGGSWSIYHNPAQLANLEGTQLNSGYSKIFGFDFLPYYTLGFSYPISKDLDFDISYRIQKQLNIENPETLFILSGKLSYDF